MTSRRTFFGRLFGGFLAALGLRKAPTRTVCELAFIGENAVAISPDGSITIIGRVPDDWWYNVGSPSPFETRS